MLTLLDVVQDILSDTNSDEVNSISDTVEAERVARIVLSTYRAMVSNRNWPSHKKTFSLTSSANSERPTHMTAPDDLKEMVSVEYNRTKATDDGRQRWGKVKWKDNESFLRYISSRNSTDTDRVKTVTDASGITLLILKDKAPEYYTSFDDRVMIFDSFDESVDTVLQSSKTRAIGYRIPTQFTMVDGFTFDLPEEAQSALIEESRVKAQLRINSMNDVDAREDSLAQQRWLSRKAWRMKGGIRYPNFGRK